MKLLLDLESNQILLLFHIPGNQVEGLDDLMMNQEKAAPQTPSIPHTVSRTKDPETAEPLTRSRRTTTRRAVLDQGSKKDVAETPAPAASSTTSRTRGRKAQVASSVPVRTRQSVRLLEKNMAELSLKDSKARAAAPVIKMDSLDQTVEEYHQVSGMCLWRYLTNGYWLVLLSLSLYIYVYIYIFCLSNI